MNITELNFLETVDTVNVIGGIRNPMKRNNESQLRPINVNVNITFAPQINIITISNVQIAIAKVTIDSLKGNNNSIKANGVNIFEPIVNVN
jgi:hypothetical protein